MEKLFLQILEMSVTAGYCILVVLVLRLLIKRLPKLYSYILWIVVYFRLVCPVSVNSVFSLVRVQSQWNRDLPSIMTRIGLSRRRK